MRARFPRHSGDVLTALRIVATPVFAALVWNAPQSVATGWLAGSVFAAIAASDFFDGRMARRAGGASTRGRILDHGADIGFILTALGTYVALALVPWWVPAAIATSFATYVYDSWRGSANPGGVRTVANRVGHLGGVLNYILVGVLVFNNSAAIQLLSRDTLRVLFALVPLYSGAAVVQRRWREVVALDTPLPQSQRGR